MLFFVIHRSFSNYTKILLSKHDVCAGFRTLGLTSNESINKSIFNWVFKGLENQWKLQFEKKNLERIDFIFSMSGRIGTILDKASLCKNEDYEI